jgi:signal transduction histidine kinase
MFSIEPGPDFKLQTVNRAFVKTFDAGIEEFINHYIDDISKLNTTSIKPKLFEVLKFKSQVSFEDKIILNGNRLTFESTLSPLIDENGNCIFIIGSSRNISERIKAQEDLKISKNQLRDLAANLQNIREEERSAIAREIHDELGQVLTYLKINLTLLGKNFTPENNEIIKTDLQSDIDGMIEIIDKTVKRIRKLITELRPEVLDNLGLIPALEWQIQEFTEKTGIRCTFNKSIDEIDLDKQISIAVFRIFQEALTNIVKHAKAKNIFVNLNYDDMKLSLEISDDGIGIDEKEIQNKKTFGILGMRERAIILGGNLNIESRKDFGTKLIIDIPLNEVIHLN